jgi:hypothetical protein
MSRIVFVALATALGWAAWAGAAESPGRYAVVVKKDVADGPWGKVVRFLADKHKGQVFAYDKSPEDVRKAVGAFHPRYVCFVCLPTENFPEFALVANQFCRTLDDDPYVDAIWGILTGFDEEHALELARSEPIAIHRGFTKTLGAWLNWLPDRQTHHDGPGRGSAADRRPAQGLLGSRQLLDGGGELGPQQLQKLLRPGLDEAGEKGVVRMTYKVRVNFVGEGNKRTAEKYDGWRIFAYLLPYQVTETKVEKSDFAHVVLPGETIIWDAGKGLKVGDERSVVFTAKRVLD